jgi:sec-independent protein translocase protein TatB
VPDIGLGELVVIAAIALLVFGDRLPKVAADAARALRQVRQMATAARKDLADAAGLEGDPELASAVRDLRDLDPRRVLEPLDDPAPSGAGATRPGVTEQAGPSAPASTFEAGPDGPGATRANGAPAAQGPGQGPGSPATAEAPPRPAVDPDWT